MEMIASRISMASSSCMRAIACKRKGLGFIGRIGPALPTRVNGGAILYARNVAEMIEWDRLASLAMNSDICLGFRISMPVPNLQVAKGWAFGARCQPDTVKMV